MPGEPYGLIGVRGGRGFRDEQLVGRQCTGGLDLSTTTDLTALVLAFPWDGVRWDYVLRSYFWVPAEGAADREQRDRVPYTRWIREGWIRATPGKTISYGQIRRDVNALATHYQILDLGIDRWNATQLAGQLEGDGLTIELLGQGFATLNAPSKELERLVISGRVHHGDHPVLTWCAANVVVENGDQESIKPSKAKSTERIDGIVALIMALRQAMQLDPNAGSSFYDNHDVEDF